MTANAPVLALTGGVGGAKLALGLARVLAPGALTIVANTGDDFEHLGLHISPDLDTVTYALAGVDNPVTGWGRRNETWSFMDALAELGGETWFKLGDRDLALHVERTRRLHNGETLSSITADIARRFGIASRILPMSDDCVRTVVRTREGALALQRYFVERQCVPEVTGFAFEGAAQAAPHPAILSALRDPRLRAVLICPSNPYISIDPMLALPGLRAALMGTTAPVIAVSPIVGGRAVKGPTAKMMTELGHAVDVTTVAAHYGDILDGYVIDPADGDRGLAVPTIVVPTLMKTLPDRESLATSVLDFADSLSATSMRRAIGERR
ncbi:MAG: 2-phospho-L-lactate transferase [Hyphomicrobiales bacterium]|nr:2-phospho-L-lactate transferase [Hyphomicrobiales bacterium]